MIDNSHNHCLVILSNDYQVYDQIIRQADLNCLSIWSTNDSEQAIQIGTDCDILFGEPSRVAKIINRLQNIKWVQSTWAGVEPLFADGLRRDYLLTNARNVYGELTSEYVFGYLLMIERKIISRWESQVNGKWDESPHGSLKGKVIGLLGVGSIGAVLAKTAHHFGMKVHGYTRQSESCLGVDQYFHPGDMLEFVAGLDYLVCTLPGTPDTKGLMSAEILRALPSKAWVVNVGRGSSIDETALVDALNNGLIAGAILDVFNQEPLPPDHPFWRTPNTFITCHTAAINYPPDIAALFIKNYLQLINGKPLLHQVDFDKWY